MKRIHSILMPLLLAWFPVIAFAAVPTLISYQGNVSNGTATPIGSPTPVNRTVTFRLWNHASAIANANRLYAEQSVVTINNGDFSVLIGQGAATGESVVYPSLATNPGALFNGNDIYLGITVDDGNAGTVDVEISPRQRIVTTAFAFRAKVAESVDNAAISSAMLANNAVNSVQINNAAVTTEKIGADQITSALIANGAVGTTELADNAVTTAKIAADAVTSAKIADGNVLTADLGDNAVTTLKISADAVTSAKITDGAIIANDLASNAITNTKLTDGSVTSTKLADGSVTNTKIADGAVTVSKIADGNVTNAKIGSSAVDSSKLGSGTIRAEENLRIVRGEVGTSTNGTSGISNPGTGAIRSGTGFTVARTAAAPAGDYTISFGTPFGAIPTVTVSPAAIGPVAATVYVTSVSSVRVVMYNTTQYAQDFPFTFIAIGPR